MSLAYHLLYLTPPLSRETVPIGAAIEPVGKVLAIDFFRHRGTDPRLRADAFRMITAIDRHGIAYALSRFRDRLSLGPKVAILEGASDPHAHVARVLGGHVTTPEDRTVVRAYAPGVCVHEVRRYRRDTHDPTARTVQDLGVPAYLILAEPGPGWNACALTPCPGVWVRLRSVEWLDELGEEHRCAREETDVVWWRRDLARDPSTARP